MRELYVTTIDGEILWGSAPMRCPTCRTSKGLTVYGYLGGPARMKCPGGHEFAVPAPFDAERLMEQTANSPRRTTTSYTFGSLPDPDHFRRRD
jgi:hypothetical protein